jgi:Fe-S-cluster-containing hydrogenase component 2
MRLSKLLIEVIPEHCTGCLRCQLACSEKYTKTFNPSAARIQVVFKGPDCGISFTPECTRCGICVDQCFYDALVKKVQLVKA